MKENVFDIILIGGSAGSLEVIAYLLQSLPKTFTIPVVIIVHRMKNTSSRLDKMLIKESGLRNVIEPEDKEPVKPGIIYLAPQNYHLLVEKDHSFSLDYSEPINFSRPSIDLSFESFSNVYGANTLAVLLSGANKDGAEGIKKVLQRSGTALIQSPETAEYTAMPAAALEMNKTAIVQSPVQILYRILHNSNNKT